MQRIARNSYSKVVKTATSGQSFRGLSSAGYADNDVVALSFARTPIGKLGGELSSLTAPQLGATVIEECVKRAGIEKFQVEEAFMGNVVSAGVGQAPTRQSVMYAGLSLDTPSTTINKVCASGMKAVMLASQSIASGYSNVMVAGGMESRVSEGYYINANCPLVICSHIKNTLMPLLNLLF